MSKRGQLVVYSGPSGVGKGTVLKPLLAPSGKLVLSISATTRAPRPGETDGVEYHFVSKSDFEQMIAADEMLEYAQYNGNYYGTPRRFVERQLDAGQDVILEIEVQGAMQVKRICPDAIFVFVMPPDGATLRSRLYGRGTEPPEICERRLSAAREEISFAKEYDFIVVNDEIEAARDDLLAAIAAGRLLARQNQMRIDEVQKLC